MIVKELIEKLKELDQNATVEVYNGYDPEFGEENFTGDFSVEQVLEGWSKGANRSQIYKVIIG